MVKAAVVLLGTLFLCPATAVGDPIAGLASSVKELGLGEGAFVIGSYLTEAQVEQAQKSLHADTYPGTIKFPSDDVMVVADEKTNLILALYKRQDDIRADDVKQMVGYLMTRFGEPTTIAHGKLLYWAFDRSGKIDETHYNESKAVGTIEILATVKFSSTLGLTPGMGNENIEEKGIIYYIITSDQLLDRYITYP